MESPYPRTRLRPYVFHKGTQQWTPEGAATITLLGKQSRARANLSIATWNVWFGSTALESRARAALGILSSLLPDVICFQEVTPPFLEIVLKEPWVREDYRTSDAAGTTLGEYGTLLLSRIPFRSLLLQELPTGQERKLLYGDISVLGHQVRVGTVHLESKRNNGETRNAQLQTVLPTMTDEESDAVLAGDFNFDPEKPGKEAQTILDGGWHDAWTKLHPNKPGHTLDTTQNAMLSVLESGVTKQSRYDRVLFHSRSDRWHPKEIHLLGTRSVSQEQPQIFPSDHFGVYARFETVTPTAVK